MLSDFALITGASKGIGRQVALKFCQAGISVLAVGRNETDLKSLQKTAIDKNGSLSYHVADLTIEDHFTDLVSRISNSSEKIKIMVHSAGAAYVGPVEKLPLSQFHILQRKWLSHSQSR